MNTNNIDKETITIERLFLEEKKISPHLICFICKKEIIKQKKSNFFFKRRRRNNSSLYQL